MSNHAPGCSGNCNNTPWQCDQDGPQGDCTCGAIYVDPACVEHGQLVEPAGEELDEDERPVELGRTA